MKAEPFFAPLDGVSTVARSLGLYARPNLPTVGGLDLTADDAPGTARAYAADIQRRFPGRPVPTLGQIMASAVGAVGTFDDTKRNALYRTLGDLGVQRVQAEGFGGPAGGFGIAPHFADSIFDQARTTIGPWSLARWLPTPALESWLPATFEASRATGQRWGGFTATFGQGETQMPAPTDGKIGLVRYQLERCLMLTTASRDLFADQHKVQYWMDYCATAEMRFAIEDAILNGVPNGVGPAGIVGHPVAVKVSRKTPNEITSTDIDSMWRTMYAGCARNAVWFTSQATLNVIDEIATTSGWPEAVYLAPGVNGGPFPLIKGRPVIVCEASAPLGSTGDLVLADMTQYLLLYRKLNPTDSPLAFEFRAEAGPDRQGMVGVPREAVEARMSDQYYFLNDVVVIGWKMRLAGDFAWPSRTPLLDVNGVQVGPASYLE